MKKIKIDLAFWLIAAIGPVLWFLDALAVSVLFKTDIVRQLFFPRSFDLVLCVLLLLFPLLVAILFHPRPPSQEQLEEQREIEDAVRREEKLKTEQAMEMARQKADERVRELEAGFAKQLESKLAEERQLIEGLIRQEEQKKAQDTVDSVRMQERRAAEEQIKNLQAGFVQELEMKLAAERKLIEAQVRSGLEGESQRAVEAVRLEEQQKAETRLKALETKLLLEFETKLVEERKRIEEAAQLQAQKSAEAAVRSLRQKYEEMVKAGQDDEKKRTVELIRMEEQKKAAEQIRALEEKYTQQIASRLAAERKQIEDAARAEEQKKAEEAVRTLRQRYEEQLRAGKTAAPAPVPSDPAQQKALEERFEKELSSRLAQERVKIETALKAEMEKKIKNAVPPPPAAAVTPAAAASVQVPALSKLVTGISQQVMNPLSGVLNNIKLIKIKMLQGGDMKSKEIKEALDLMEDSAFLCKNILSSMSLPAAGSRGATQPVALNTIVAKIDALMGNELKLQNISIQKVLQENLSPVTADAWLLTQLLFNLVSNAKWAIKSNPVAHAGTITITTRMSEQNDKVELLVADNGIGIPQGDIGRIFDPFFTTKQDGLGLGLTVAQNIVKAHNGDIRVESKEDKGTTFTITLPAASS